jgi:hypothetical protein
MTEAANLDLSSLGERKARYREQHLCLRCSHHLVCGMASSLDLNLLVTISSCLAFEPDGSDGSHEVCELLPIEPFPSTYPPAQDCSSHSTQGTMPCR